MYGTTYVKKSYIEYINAIWKIDNIYNKFQLHYSSKFTVIRILLGT